MNDRTDHPTVEATTVTPGDYPLDITLRSHVLHADVGESSGGKDSAPNPHDYFDAALAACKAQTAIWYAKRKNIPLEHVHTRVERDASDERSGVYRLRVHVTFTGPLDDEQRAALQRAVAACPVHKLMTRATIEIETVA